MTCPVMSRRPEAILRASRNYHSKMDVNNHDYMFYFFSPICSHVVVVVVVVVVEQDDMLLLLCVYS